MLVKKPFLKKELLHKVNVDGALAVLEVDSALLSDLSYEDRTLDEVNLTEVIGEQISFQSAVIEELKISDSKLKKINFAGAKIKQTFLQRAEGKEYVVVDGDVIEFRHS